MSTAPDYLRFAQMLLNGGELDGVRVMSEVGGYAHSLILSIALVSPVSPWGGVKCERMSTSFLPPPPHTQASVAAMASNQLPAHLLPYHMTSFPEYKGSAFGFGVMVIQDWEVAPGTAPEGEVRV